MACELKDLKGRGECTAIFGEMVQAIFVPKTASWASLSAMITALDLAVVSTDNDVKAYPTSFPLEEYTPEQGEANIRTFQSGRTNFVSKGVFKYGFLDNFGGAGTYEAYLSLNNKSLAVIPIDKNGTIQVVWDKDNQVITGVPIASNSISPQLMPSNGTSDMTQGVMVSFNLDPIDLGTIKVASLSDIGEDLRDKWGALTPVDAEYTSPTATSCVVQLFADVAGLPINTGITEAVIGSLVSLWIDGGAEVTPTSLTPIAGQEGFYTLAYPSSAGTLIPTWAIDGYNMYQANQGRIVIP